MHDVVVVFAAGVMRAILFALIEVSQGDYTVPSHQGAPPNSILDIRKKNLTYD